MAEDMTARGNRFGILLMILSSFCACIGQLFWKLYTDGNLFNLCVGFLLYAAGFMAMIIAYRYGSVSKLQPILSLSYVFAILIGYAVLGESIAIYKISGIASITAGVAIIGRSAD